MPYANRRLLTEAAVVACVVFGAYAISRPDAVATLGRLYDDIVYLSVGKSIADGSGFRSVHMVGSPVHVKFPPLLPAVYALGWLTFGSLPAVAAFAAWLNIVIASASAGVLWWLARSELGAGRTASTLFVLAPLLTAKTMFYFTGAMSEPWMLLGWSVALFLMAQMVRRITANASVIGLSVALGVVLALTVLARTQGIAVAGAMLIGLALMRIGFRPVLVAGASLVIPLAVWHVWHGAMMAVGPLSPLPDQIGYASWFPMHDPSAFLSFAIQMTRLTASVYWRNFADVLMGYASAKTLLVSTVWIACGALGVVLVMRRWPPLGLSILAMGAILAIWPYAQDRFLTPVLPVLGLCAAFGVQRVIDRMPLVIHRLALGGAAMVAALILVVNVKLRFEATVGAGVSPFARAIGEMARRIETSTKPSDHIMVSWGGAIYLRTGRQTSIPNPEEAIRAPSVYASPNRFLAGRILADSVDHAIVWDGAPGREGPALAKLAVACPGLLTEVVTDSAAAVRELHFYRVRRDVACLEAFAKDENGNAGTSNKNAP